MISIPAVSQEGRSEDMLSDEQVGITTADQVEQ